jgi:hypothetical protein
MHPRAVEAMRDDEEWKKRRPMNIRLGIALGVVAFLVFLLAFWKFRPI